MSELKSVYIDRTGDWCRSGNDTGKFYLKSEADRYISELIADQQLELDEWYCKVEHQKFMRCNLLIDYCGLKQNTCEEEKVPFWRKWYFRWCEISDKFKEAE